MPNSDKDKIKSEIDDWVQGRGAMIIVGIVAALIIWFILTQTGVL